MYTYCAYFKRILSWVNQLVKEMNQGVPKKQLVKLLIVYLFGGLKHERSKVSPNFGNLSFILLENKIFMNLLYFEAQSFRLSYVDNLCVAQPVNKVQILSARSNLKSSAFINVQSQLYARYGLNGILVCIFVPNKVYINIKNPGRSLLNVNLINMIKTLYVPTRLKARNLCIVSYKLLIKIKNV